MTKIYQLMLSQVPEHFNDIDNGLPAMTYADFVEIQAEFIVTTENAIGETFAGGMTPWAWFEKQGVAPWAYFDAAWPNPQCNKLTMYIPLEDAYRDPYWLRREHCRGLNDNPAWTVASPVSGRPFTNAANADYREYLLQMLTNLDIPRVLFDDGGWLKKTDAVNDGWETFYQAYRKTGTKVVVNGAWEPSVGWEYPMMDSVDGMLIEAWARNRPHFVDPDSGMWRATNDADIERICRDWTAAGKTAIILARWEPDKNPPIEDYDDFCTYYLEMAKRTGAVFCPAKWNYFTSADGEWLENNTVEPPTDPDDPTLDDLTERVEVLENYTGALMDEVENLSRQMLEIQELRGDLSRWAAK